MAKANRIKYLHIALLMVGIAAQTGTLSAQQVTHLNPVIAKLAAGQPFIGFQTEQFVRPRTPAPWRARMPTMCTWTWSIRRWIFRR